MATLGLKEMGKFLWEGMEKGLPCWLSQFSKTKLKQPTVMTLASDIITLHSQNSIIFKEIHFLKS